MNNKCELHSVRVSETAFAWKGVQSMQGWPEPYVYDTFTVKL